MGKQIRNPHIGLISRIDYGSPGFRTGIVRAGFQKFDEEETDFNILVGGLIDAKAIAAALKAQTTNVLSKERAAKKNYRRFSGLSSDEARKLRTTELKEAFLYGLARDLAKIIPISIRPDPEHKKNKLIDLFLVLSPAFDGELGEKIAHYLKDLRADIRFANVGSERMPIKFIDKLLWVLAPSRTVWMRSDYYSTSHERVLKDKIKQTTWTPPDLFAIGCFGASINKPKGELEYPYIAVPAAHRIEQPRVNENQIGVSVLEWPIDGGQYRYRTHSLKDVVGQELNFILPPRNASNTQKSIVRSIKRRGYATVGTLSYDLQEPPDKIRAEINRLMQKDHQRHTGGHWPGIIEKEGGKKFAFDLDRIQRSLRYSFPKGEVCEDRIVSFGCLHAGSVETDYEFFLEKVPQHILDLGATILVDGGDTVEGLKHNLAQKGEIVAGLNNYTRQEQLAAYMTGTVIFKVFKERFAECLAKHSGSLTEHDVIDFLGKSLLKFYCKMGNHDAWQSEDGHDPLIVFKLTMIPFLTDQIETFMRSLSIPRVSVRKIVEQAFSICEFFTLPSGLHVSLQHPYMSRAKTTSLRPQEMLAFARRHGCQIAIGANFHVAENVEEWDMDLGQCVCQEIGTIKHGSNFERNKMKMVDQGIGWLLVRSVKVPSGESKILIPRIIMTESAFFGEPRLIPPIDNTSIVNDWIKQFSLPALPRTYE